MREIPTARSVMTPNPVTISNDKPARTAISMMDDLGIRHLPVTHGHNVVGVVSERDLRVASGIEKQANIIVTVGDLCNYDVYSVTPDTPLDIVIEQMEHRIIGSAVVMESGHVLGLITTVDVCRAFKDLMRSAALREPTAESYLG